MKKLASLAIAVLLIQGVAFAADPIKIGISFSDFETERWPVEAELMQKLADEQGVEVVLQVANFDAKLQNEQIKDLILQGVKAIIIICQDSNIAASAVDLAAAQGIPCIAYDRLIRSTNLAVYLSFDNFTIGRMQAEAIIKRVSKGKFALLAGNPIDNTAAMFHKGQMEVLQPYIDKGDITIVAEEWIEDWSSANAAKLMEKILAAQGNAIDAVVASNDGIALGALQALKAQGLAGKVPISGQDASAAGCKSIVEGELTMTIYKDVRLLVPIAIDMAVKLAKGEKLEDIEMLELSDLLVFEKLQGKIPCKLLKAMVVDQNNIYDEIIKSGFQSYDDVYQDIPKDKRPAKP